MCTLYMIGNGFDLAHRLPTSYWDFRKFLEAHDLDFLIEFENLYGIPQIDVGDPYTNATAWQDSIKALLWGSLEENMSHVDTTSIVNMSDSIVDQLGLDGGNWGIEDTMNEYWRERFSFLEQLPEYVQQWVESIDLSNTSPRKSSLVGIAGAKFLTFNYTATLEECYRIDPDSIIHMHGALPHFADYGPVMGHGFKAGIADHRIKAHEADAIFDEGRKSIENALADIFQATIKDTELIIREHENYFRSLHSCDHVVVIGLSYCQVDIPYLLAVKRHISPAARWTMFYYSDDDMLNLEKAIATLNIEKTLIDPKRTDEFWDS